MKYVIGVDVGATKISAAIIANNHAISKTITHPTESHLGKKIILANIIKIIKIFDSSAVHSIGIGIAGEINRKKGILISSPNMAHDVKNVPIAKIIKKEFKKDVYIENDAKCFVLAESILGAGKKYDFVVGLTLGTGIGGGIVMHKKLYCGSLGIAGEIGHMTIADNGSLCGCGQRGHLESYASGTGMIHLYKEMTGKTRDTYTITQKARDGDATAKRVIKIMAQSLGIGLANIMSIIDPDIIVIGGGMACVRPILGPAIKIARKSVLYPSLRKTPIVRAVLKENANIYGAAIIAQNQQ